MSCVASLLVFFCKIIRYVEFFHAEHNFDLCVSFGDLDACDLEDWAIANKTNTNTKEVELDVVESAASHILLTPLLVQAAAVLISTYLG